METPIYLVVLEARRGPGYYNAAVWDVLMAVPCFLQNAEAIFRERVSPLFEQGKQLDVRYIAREPYPNPFQEAAALEP